MSSVRPEFSDTLDCIESLINTIDSNAQMCCGDYNVSFDKRDAHLEHLKKLVSRNNLYFTLYIMSIEPLLMCLHNEPHFQGITLPLDGAIKLTAYVDDVNLYVTQSSDINIINSIRSTYQSVSNVNVNWTKSCGLKMNGWDVGLNCKLCISWNTKEQNCVCVFFLGGGKMMQLC